MTRTAKLRRYLRESTAGEQGIHEATHLPFCLWCAECVTGPPHRKIAQNENAGQ